MIRLPYLLAALLFFLLLGTSSAVRADALSDVRALHYSGQSAAAIGRADEFLAITPNDPPMRFLKGVMLADAKRDAEAIELFQKLTEDYPDLAEPYNNLAAIYASAGDYIKARAALEQALRTNPGYSTAHENLGDVYAALASRSYARALQLEPRNVSVPPKLASVRELFKSKPRVAQGADTRAP